MADTTDEAQDALARRHSAAQARAEARALERLAEAEEKERALTREVYEVTDRVITRHGYDPQNDRAIERLRCMRDAAVILGSDSLASFARCVRTLDRFEARLRYDTSPLSVCWEGHGFFGGMIFHPSDREWSIHT